MPRHRILLRLLGAVHLVAFVSLWVQVDGLIGSRGILPAGEFFAYLDRVLGPGTFERLAKAPSLLWFSSSDTAIHVLCAAGVVLSLLALAGMVTVPIFGALWLCYLSLVWGGQTFLAFQWDTLLLEATVCAVVLAPVGWRTGSSGPPADLLMARIRAAFQVAPDATAGRPGVWLFRLLVVKLMFLSGAVKLLSLDSTWWQLTALDVHYFTQPLPVTASWYAHHLPDWFQRLSVLIMFGVELVVPWCVFSRRLRQPGMWLLLAFQFLIAATGNYGFFNLLTAVLCLSWLDTGGFGWMAGRGGQVDSPAQPAPAAGDGSPLLAASRRIRWAAAAAILCLSLLVAARELTRSLPRGPDTPPVAGTAADLVDRVLVDPATPLLRAIAPFRSINGYGLFRAMTTSRPEIVVETSADGMRWTELAFRFKPGDSRRPPRAAQPHMPRLDWQMWFAALDPQRADWLGPFVTRVFEGEPAVLRLLGAADRRTHPPNYLRLRLYDYTFSEPGAGRAYGAAGGPAVWWRRELLYDLSPVLERTAFVPVPDQEPRL